MKIHRIIASLIPKGEPLEHREEFVTSPPMVLMGVNSCAVEEVIIQRLLQRWKDVTVNLCGAVKLFAKNAQESMMCIHANEVDT